ncbi:hypothetical protein RAC89_27645 [Paenibacillus sp. GD4]|uniref:hypothetical protein n=1 Tax=Paenibacillus sp. GD4 TaxID=3068890 RepID=UPI002796BB37|nr:hypothetical protein [Paenibacillus sp. GD4]MDQ1914175.1 hypothetical protein [Paenibacillus sp. GD4]
MKFHRRSIISLVSLVMLLILSSLSPAASAPVAASSVDAQSSVELASGAQTLGSASLGRVDIGETGFMELKDVMLLPGDVCGTTAFTLNVYNGSNADLEFNPYWIRLLSEGGNSFQVRLLPQDKNKNRIPPQSSETFSFYAKLNADTRLQDLVFQLIQMDFSVPGFEKVLGQIDLPEDYSYVTPTGWKRSLNVGGVPFHHFVTRVSVSQNDEYYLPAISFEMENVGRSGAKLPELSYYLRTKGGAAYPLQTSELLKDSSIQPFDKKEGLLSGSIPKEAGTEGWELVIAQTVAGGDTGGSIQLPVASFEVPFAAAEKVSIGNEYDFTNADGTYTARLTSLQRLPWEEKDVLTAAITVMNKGIKALLIPELQGYYLLDDMIRIDAARLENDHVASLQPGKEITIQMAANIPYTYDFQEIKLILQEKETTEKSKDLVTFYHNKELMNITVIPAGESRKLTDWGQSAVYTVRGVHIFEGDVSELYAVQLEVENREKRLALLRKQVAQLRAADGTLFPATVSESKSKLIPGGKALLYLWAKLPKGYATEGMQLILGDEIPGTPTPSKDAAAAQAMPEGYVNAASFALPAEKKEPKGDFSNLEVFPYTVSFSRFGTQANFIAGTLLLDFDYELKKNFLVEADMKDHKIIVELRDELANNGKDIIFSKAFGLDGADASQSLLPGQHDAQMSYTDKDKVFAVQYLKTYELNIYHQFQDGHKKLLASKELDWFVYSD